MCMMEKPTSVHDHDPMGHCPYTCPAYKYRDNVRITRTGDWKLAEEQRRAAAAPIVGGPLMACQ